MQLFYDQLKACYPLARSHSLTLVHSHAQLCPLPPAPHLEKSPPGYPLGSSSTILQLELCAVKLTDLNAM